MPWIDSLICSNRLPFIMIAVGIDMSFVIMAGVNETYRMGIDHTMEAIFARTMKVQYAPMEEHSVVRRILQC
jgi:hypothetical protein